MLAFIIYRLSIESNSTRFIVYLFASRQMEHFEGILSKSTIEVSIQWLKTHMRSVH